MLLTGRAHSERLTALIQHELATAGGWLPFARYMELALYAPALGYYAAGATKLASVMNCLAAW